MLRGYRKRPKLALSVVLLEHATLQRPAHPVSTPSSAKYLKTSWLMKLSASSVSRAMVCSRVVDGGAVIRPSFFRAFWSVVCSSGDVSCITCASVAVSGHGSAASDSVGAAGAGALATASSPALPLPEGNSCAIVHDSSMMIAEICSLFCGGA